ncbi:23S rRNA (uracil(1939)-C(5))-methyltransferase RlmD [Alteribacillus sp. HJP-4]|uniref:23S rRNA (uracil(1939)-C(5))-methyltransferase RlmD n=1 Tax=Alteribacillus sp. HJP-4 TaxID=2775394 RepID=UPI0035CCF0AC
MKKDKQHSKELTEGSEFPVTVKRLGINGEGVGFFKRKAVFVPGALPGEVIVCKAVKVSTKHILAKVKKIRQSSPERINAPCPVYEKCGGCQLQHLSYQGQLLGKKDMVVQAFERYAKKHRVYIKDTIGMEEPWYYRNKSQWQVRSEHGTTKAGLFAMNSNKLVDLTGPGCMVEEPLLNKISKTVIEIAKELRLPVHHQNKNKQGLRTIAARISTAAATAQLTIITSSPELPEKLTLVKRIRERLPEVVSIFHNVQPTSSSVIFGKKTRHLWGETTIKESLKEQSFNLSPHAFFQLNPRQAEVLYEEARIAADLDGTQKVIDAYCGTGTIGLWMAGKAKEIRGMDTIASAVNDANENAAAHGYLHAKFYNGRAEEIIPRWSQQGWNAEVIIVDPPRTGCANSLLKTIVKTKPKKFIYVSCNPSTLAKDADFLLNNGFELTYIQPVDMFPQTAQTEAVAKFVLK